MQEEKKHISQKARERLMRLASYCSVLTALLLILIKIISFFMTNSLALLSSLMDSGLDLGASVVSLIAIQQALVPPDKDHRFGHGKAEALGGLVQGVIICLSGIFLIIETVSHIMNPVPLERLDIGLAVMVLSIFVTIALVSFQRFVIKRTESIAVDADSAHYTGDVMMNIGVIISMLFAYLLGWHWIDPVFALIVAAYLFYSAFHIIKKVITVLMDKELPADTRKKIEQIVLQHNEILGMSDLRTRNAGISSFIQFSIMLDGKTELKNAHLTCNKLEDEVKEALSHCEVFIHPEPANETERKNNGRKEKFS